MVSVFGIRHHGPGSTKTLLKALEQLQPDCILIEGPQDAEDMLEYITDEAMIPPVAMLIYNIKNLKQAAYLPFTSFSPEWQAARFGLHNEIPVHFMDLPMSINFALDQAAKENIQLKVVEEKTSDRLKPLSKDPLGYLAKLAGYTDSERWWETHFEQEENDILVFDTILELMGMLREEVKGEEAPRTLLREAFMRKTIRQNIKAGYQNIAVVCGAWHAPVLKDYLNFKQSADNALLKGLKKNKAKATWIPWTYHRLAFQSGYGAGVLSPAWYDLLFNHEQEVNARWMISVGQLLRKEDLDASAAHVMEAVRLAESLALIRKKSIAGIDELEEAAKSVFCEGREEKLDLIRNKLIIGEVMGEVPDYIPLVPLQQDLEKTIKTARLAKERKSLSPIERKLDLRKETNLIASQLLHRLLLLGIHWGKEVAVSDKNTGSFSELWSLCWDPEFEIRIIEAGMWGNTVKEAAMGLVQKKALEIDKLQELTTLAGKVLKADLPEVIQLLIKRIQEVAALSRDTAHLMEALLPLVQIIRYGSSRQMDTQALEQLIDQLIPRMCIGLPTISRQIEEEVAEDLFQKLIACNSAIAILGNDEYNNAWYKALYQLTEKNGINPLMAGASTRILFDKSVVEIQETSSRMHFNLSPANPVINAAQWLEGFLHGSGLLLVYNPSLWKILDEWLDQMDMEIFKEIVPLLRRTFSRFSDTEREKMMQLAQFGQLATAHQNEWAIDEERAATILPTLKMILDL